MSAHLWTAPADVDRCQAESTPYGMGNRCLFRWRVVLVNGERVCNVHARGKRRADVQIEPCTHACPRHCRE